MPGFGGQLDYLGKDYPLLIDHSLESCMNAPPDRYYQWKMDNDWALPDVQHARKLMREVAEHPDRYRKLGLQMQGRVNQAFDAKKVCRRMAEFVGKLP